MRRLGHGRRISQIADEHFRVEVGQVPQASAGILQEIVDHRRCSAAFEHGLAREFRVVVRPSRLHPLFDLKMLVLQGVCQLVRHHHALVAYGDPVGDIELVALGVVQARDLLGEKLHDEGLHVKIFGYKAEGLHRLLRRIPLLGSLVFLHLAQHVGADFFARSQCFL